MNFKIGSKTFEQSAAMMVYDLDRCPHGRHAGELCIGCPGDVSGGNPRMLGKEPRLPDGRQILGYTVHGTFAYVLTPLEDYDIGGPIVTLVRQ